MEKAQQKKINHNNRKRGAGFEKNVAKILDMDLVPYSGSNARFGFGDVRDSIWLGECKNITPKNNKVTLQLKWFNKNRERANEIEHLPYLAWMPSGKVDKYIVLEQKEYNKIIDELNKNNSEIKVRIAAYRVQRKHNTINLIIDLSLPFIKHIRDNMIVSLNFDGVYYYIMNINVFKSLIINSGLKGERSGTQL